MYAEAREFIVKALKILLSLDCGLEKVTDFNNSLICLSKAMKKIWIKSEFSVRVFLNLLFQL